MYNITNAKAVYRNSKHINGNFLSEYMQSCSRLGFGDTAHRGDVGAVHESQYLRRSTRVAVHVSQHLRRRMRGLQLLPGQKRICDKKSETERQKKKTDRQPMNMETRNKIQKCHRPTNCDIKYDIKNIKTSFL